jgi:Zn-dependent protease
MRPTPLFKLGRLSRVARIRGVDVYAHWSVLLISALILAGGLANPRVAATGLASYLSVLAIHECGHVIQAQRLHYDVLSIELYPIYAITLFEAPRSRFDHRIIAWGGVLAQFSVGIPVVAWVIAFGYTPFESVNAVLALLGFFNLAVAAFNLLPKAPLDGNIAWGIIPELLDRARSRRNTRASPWKSRR